MDETNLETPINDTSLNLNKEDLPKYDGKSIIFSKKYRQYADLLVVKLDDDTLYTDDEVQQIISESLNQTVKTEINA